MNMRVLGIQTGTVTADMTAQAYMERQLTMLDDYMASCAPESKPAVVMFPELMTGIYFGFVREKRWFACAEDFLNGPTTKTMLDRAKKYGVHICYSLFEKASAGGADIYYNTMGLISPVRGVIGKYRKTHLPGGDLRYNPCYEKYYFLPGDTLPVFELDNGIKFAMMLCYDRSFPEVWRTYYLKGAQLICVAACTMGIRKDMFVTELQTRALESHSYVVALNRAGEERTENEPEPRKHFGSSLLIGPMGDVKSALDGAPWQYLTGEIDTDAIAYARGRLNWERDRRPELYGMVADTNFAPTGWIYERGF